MKLVHLLTAGAVALAAGLSSIQARADEFIDILTGGTSGVYYPLGAALAKIYAHKIPNTRTEVQATKASAENLNLLQEGKGDIAFALGDTLRDAWTGNREAGFTAKLDKLRAIAAIYPNYIQIVASKNSGITDLASLKGKRVSVGMRKSGTELDARAIFAAVGMRYKDLGKVEYLPFDQSVKLIEKGQLDATLQSAGLGIASINDLATSVPITLVPIPPAIAGKLRAPYQATIIPAGTYEGQTADVSTLAVVNVLVTRAGVSDEVAYQMTKQLFENLPQLVAAHKAASAIELDNAVKGLPIPLHPGAERYYKEKGLVN